MLIPADQSPILSVAYGDRQRHTVEFAHTSDARLIRRYPTWHAGWERADDVDTSNADVIAGINDLLLAYAASAA